MSSISPASTQNTTPFHWTKEIWNRAWNSQDGFSSQSLCAKVACIVFPIIFSVALAEGILWVVHSVFSISSNPKAEPLRPDAVKQAQKELRVENNQQEPAPAVEVIKKEEDVVPNPVESVGVNPPVTNETDLTAERLGGPVHFGGFMPSNVAREMLQQRANSVTAAPVAQVGNILKKNPNILTVALKTGSSQLDIEDNTYDPEKQRPPASIYTALRAGWLISLNFNSWVERIRGQKNDELSLDQRKLIELGTRDYFRVMKIDQTLKGIYDLDIIRRVCNLELDLLVDLFRKPLNRDQKPVPERVITMVDELFMPEDVLTKDGDPCIFHNRRVRQAVFIQNEKNESMVIICDEKSAIVFNANHNAITLITGKQAMQEYLMEILPTFDREGVPFSYTSGFYLSRTYGT